MKGKLSSSEKKDLAFGLYMDTDKSQKEICALIGIAEKTFSLWKKDGNWESLKGAETASAKKIISNLYKKLETLSEDPGKHSDSIIKIASSIEKLSDKRVTVPQVINVFKNFTTWLMMHDPEKAKEVNALQTEYLNEFINE